MSAALNRPVVDLAQALEPSKLADYLNYEFAEHEARVAELGAAFERFLLATKDGINDDEIHGTRHRLREGLQGRTRGDRCHALTRQGALLYTRSAWSTAPARNSPTR